MTKTKCNLLRIGTISTELSINQ